MNDKEFSVSANQIVCAVYLTVFVNLVDKAIEDSGHEALMKKIPSDKLMDVFSAFGSENNVKNIYKAVKGIVPDVFPSANIVKLMYLRAPFVIGMRIAHMYFQNDDEIISTLGKMNDNPDQVKMDI